MRKLISLLFTTAALNANAQESIHKTLYHYFDKTDLISNSQQEMIQLLQLLKEVDVRAVSIKSHTDKSGTAVYNKQLSQQRYLSLLQLFQKQLPEGANYDVGYFGEDSLLTLNDREQNKNRRTEIVIWYYKRNENTPKEITKLVSYKEDVVEQRFEINLDDTVSVTANEGTVIKFAPGTFRNNKKETATGRAYLLIKEYYNPGDILLAGMHSESDKGLLQTGGMFKVYIVQNNDTISNESQKPLQIRMPDINGFSDSMNVFASGHSDTSLWNDTRKGFRRIMSSWNWPVRKGKLNDFYIDEGLPFYKWQIGRKWTEEYYPGDPWFYWQLGRNYIVTERKPVARTVSYTVTKTDSITLTVKFHEKFRKRGYKKYNLKEFDTTFLVKYSSAMYETIISNLNYINCDRFLNYPKLTDFYVETPGFEGAQLLVYFKNINAFMQAGYENGRYRISKVPPGEEVYVIAIGKKGEEFYFSKQPFTISQQAIAEVSLQKVKYEEMKQIFKTIGYKI